MGIYIKDMETPVTCCHCPLMGYDPDIEWVDGGREAQGAYICVITHELIDNTKREDHCPLVPVPPHGRLIDADAFVRSIRDAIHYDASRGREYISAEDLHEALTNAPTIIPAEEGE